MAKNTPKESRSDRSSGDLKRNNVYSADAVRDWAWRIRSGAGGLRMNEKFTLVAVANGSNPMGICELPVRYLADHIGVGVRQAQRLLAALNRYELLSFVDVSPVGRPNDVVRKFVLNLTIDPDTWSPAEMPLIRQGQRPLMRRIQRQAFLDAIRPELEKVASKFEFNELICIDVIGVRSKQLDFVSPRPDATNAAFKHKNLILRVASRLTDSEVTRLHMIPRKGYRDR